MKPNSNLVYLDMKLQTLTPQQRADTENRLIGHLSAIVDAADWQDAVDASCPRPAPAPGQS